jgi:hypothetical protein
VSLFRQQPRCADERVPREGQLVRRREDLQSPLGDLVDEHRLAVAKVSGDRLALFRGHLGSVEEDAERVALAAVVGREDAQDVKQWHRRVPL